jgi:hypothetical protein
MDTNKNKIGESGMSSKPKGGQNLAGEKFQARFSFISVHLRPSAVSRCLSP